MGMAQAQMNPEEMMAEEGMEGQMPEQPQMNEREAKLAELFKQV
jgi:hypothetical protein